MGPRLIHVGYGKGVYEEVIVIHQGRLWRRTWQVWVGSGVVEAEQRVLWVDAGRAYPDGQLELGCSAEGYGGTRPEHVYMGPCRSLEVCYCMVKVARLGQGCGTHIRSRRLWKDKVSIGLLSRLYPGGGCGKSGYGVGWSR